MKIAICTGNPATVDVIKEVILKDHLGAEFEVCLPYDLPYAPEKYAMAICDRDSLLRIWYDSELRKRYMSRNTIATIAGELDSPIILYKLYTEYGISMIEACQSCFASSPMIPLFANLDEITEDGKANDLILYDSASNNDSVFAVRYGNDTLIAEYTDRVDSGSRVIVSIASKRCVGRLRLHKDGVSVSGKFYSYEDCETLPLFIIARIKKVLRGRN